MSPRSLSEVFASWASRLGNVRSSSASDFIDMVVPMSELAIEDDEKTTGSATVPIYCLFISYFQEKRWIKVTRTL